MIEYIYFYNWTTTGSYWLNQVSNGVGCALKRFEPSIEDVRHTNNDLPYSHGVVPTYTSLGRQLVEMEGDVMHNTPTGYWTERMNLQSAFLQPYPTDLLGILVVMLTGQTEEFWLDASMVGTPSIPVGLAGATISPWRIVLAGNDPWFRGGIQRSQNAAANTTTTLAGMAGNAPAWPTFTITGPINNPEVLYRGQTYALFNYNLPAGQQIFITPRFRQVVGSGGVNLYSLVQLGMGWVPFDPRMSPQTIRLNGTSTTGATQLNATWYNGYTI